MNSNAMPLQQHNNWVAAQPHNESSQFKQNLALINLINQIMSSFFLPWKSLFDPVPDFQAWPV